MIHIVADKLTDLSGDLASIGAGDTAFPLPHGRGDEFHHGSPDGDPRDKAPKVRDIYIPDLHIDTLKLKPRNFH